VVALLPGWRWDEHFILSKGISQWLKVGCWDGLNLMEGIVVGLKVNELNSRLLRRGLS